MMGFMLAQWFCLVSNMFIFNQYETISARRRKDVTVVMVWCFGVHLSYCSNGCGALGSISGLPLCFVVLRPHSRKRQRGP